MIDTDVHDPENPDLLCLPQNTGTASHLAHCYGYLLGQIERCTTQYQEPHVADYGDDPQADEDQHVQAIHHRNDTLQPEP